MSLAEKIYEHYEDTAEDSRRDHLGASLIGRPCERAAWYTFRWCSEVKFAGRILRLFQRGHREEPEFIRELRAMGAEVHAMNTDGSQFGFKKHGGHFAGSYDGAARYIPGASNQDWYLLEFKTHGEKSYSNLLAKGMRESKPEHYAQMQTYMHNAGLKQGMYISVNKNDDSIYTEEVDYDEEFALRVESKALHVVKASEPLARICDDPTRFGCRFCDHRAACWDNAIPQVSCRTCTHATPDMDGNQRWACEYRVNFPSPEKQRIGCNAHIFIPALLPYELVGGSQEENYAEYKTKDGKVFRNTNEQGEHNYTSHELVEVGKNYDVINNKFIEDMREQFNAKLGTGNA